MYRREGSVSADEFEFFLGNKATDHLNQRLLGTWRTHGEEAARRFCINDADKFNDDKTKLFLERELFGAGKDGLVKKTPWNTYKRKKAGLPHLHSYEESVS